MCKGQLGNDTYMCVHESYKTITGEYWPQYFDHIKVLSAVAVMRFYQIHHVDETLLCHGYTNTNSLSVAGILACVGLYYMSPVW